jgi:hypothetical protein
MATARSQSIADYDILSVRTILAKNPDNSLIPSFAVLTSDPCGTASWSTLSTSIPSFLQVRVGSQQYLPTLESNTLTLQGTTSIGAFQSSGTAVLYTKAFTQLNVKGQQAISGPILTLSSLGNTSFQTNSTLNLINYQVNPTQFLFNGSAVYLSPKLSTLTIAGTGEFLISTTSQGLGFSVSTFTSSGFRTLETTTSSFVSSIWSSLTLTYAPQSLFSTSLQDLSTTINLPREQFFSTTQRFSSDMLSSLAAYSTLTYPVFTALASNFSTSVNATSNSFLSDINATSTSLTTLLKNQTIVSTNSIFSQETYQTLQGITIKNYGAINADVFSTVSTTNSIFNYNTKRIEFTSTLTSLNALQQITSTQIIKQISPFLSTFSQTLTSTFIGSTISTANRVNLFSTLPFKLHRGPAIGWGYDLLLSTFEISLAPLIPYVDTQTKLFLHYSPNYSFTDTSPLRIGADVRSVNAYANYSFMTVGTNSVPDVEFMDYMPAYFNTLGPTFVVEPYTRPLRYELSTGFLLANYSTPYVMKHLHGSLLFGNTNFAHGNESGGLVIPYAFAQDCLGNTQTKAYVSHRMDPSTSVGVYMYNALLSR